MERSILADPVAFSERMFQTKLWSQQKAILRAIERNRRVAVKSAHSTGKTHAAALAALWYCARYEDARVVIIAPGWMMVRSVIWSEIHGLLAKARFRLPFTSENQMEVKFGPKNMIIGLSTNDAARLQGQHSERLLVIVDEAPGLDPTFWPSIEGTLASGDSRLLMLGNPTVTSGPFYDSFGRSRAAWKTFSISAFDSPNFKNVTLERLLKMTDAELDKNPLPYLTTRRWVRERYAEWFNGGIENSPLWASRVLGEFPRDSSNALFSLAALEQAQRAARDAGGDIVVGVDPAGPGKDRTVCVACAGGAILDTQISTAADASPIVLAFLRKHSTRLRIAKVDSNGLGFHLVTIIHSNGFPAEGLNASSAAQERERFANLKAERYWNLRERFQRGEVSGLSDDMLGELAAINYTIDARGKTAIEDKASVRSALGRSPDLAEALMLALGEPAYEPYRYAGLLQLPDRSPFAARGSAASCQARDDEDDLRGDSTFFVNDSNRMTGGAGDPQRYGSVNRRKAW